ncbi:hypothetical protein P43SY_010618 [Pythium insidiosum]|uniref:Tc1-like transposase DDE domain-containing protein n=1 Tax=Pythium insidiosum TaxID=114742 RepID=A0AAD5Q0V1_PYTIN|nr:hypothetical protein P43SY_010618 [Pythium insidiosum]
MYGSEIRWRAVTLVYAYAVPFIRSGHVMPAEQERRDRYPADVIEFISSYVASHPCFFVEELQSELKLTRKVLERRAREAAPMEILTYKAKLAAFYTYPEQLIFIDETAKKGVDAMRKYAWAPRGKKAIVQVPFRKGSRVSVLAACDTRGFVAWVTTDGTFSRCNFHAAFIEKVVPLLNPWPLPRSIVVLDNARIHMYRELEDAVHQCGALLLYLPPYCPHLNPIEVYFGRLKRWLTRHANLAFPASPELVLEVAMKECLRDEASGCNLE